MIRNARIRDRISIPRREGLVLLILAAVQFATIVDFMIVMPLGPQLMRKLQLTPAEFGLIVSSYTFAAGATGLVASSVIDRFGRRAMFLFLYSGFLAGTLLCAFAPNYESLLAARVLTGAFGGILGGIAMAIVGDVFPEHQRGRATGALMMGFSLASIAGVPLGLLIGNQYGWHAPFVALAIGGLPALILAPWALPPLRDHVGARHSHPFQALAATMSRANHLRAFALMTTLMIGSFLVFPYLADFLVENVKLSEARLPLVYIAGGAATLFTSPLVGRLADRYGKLLTFRVIAPGSALLLVIITHLPASSTAIAVAAFGALMVFNSGRMIPAMAMITSSVEPHRRGAFMSANSSIQHIAAGVGASLGGMIVTKSASGQIHHFGTAGWIAAAATLLSVWMAGGVRILRSSDVSAEAISLVAAAEATADAGEPIADCSG